MSIERLEEAVRHLTATVATRGDLDRLGLRVDRLEESVVEVRQRSESNWNTLRVQLNGKSVLGRLEMIEAQLDGMPQKIGRIERLVESDTEQRQERQKSFDRKMKVMQLLIGFLTAVLTAGGAGYLAVQQGCGQPTVNVGAARD